MKNLIRLLLLLLVLSVPLRADVCTTYYTDVVNIVAPMGWVVTSTTGGKHNIGSKHPIGKAVDVSVRMKTVFDIMLLTEVMEAQGYIVRDERARPFGQAVWRGPHIHISIPYCK